jgi:hypothetical protein
MLAHHSLLATHDLLDDVSYNLEGTGFTRRRAMETGALTSHADLVSRQQTGLSYLAARMAATDKEPK